MTTQTRRKTFVNDCCQLHPPAIAIDSTRRLIRRKQPPPQVDMARKPISSCAASPCPDIHPEHRLQELHGYALPSYPDRLLPPHQQRRQPRRRSLLRPARRRFPNPLARLGTIPGSLPIDGLELRLFCPGANPIAARGEPRLSSCWPDVPSMKPSSLIVFSWPSSSALSRVLV